MILLLFWDKNVSYDKWWKTGTQSAATVCYWHCEKSNQHKNLRKTRYHYHYTRKSGGAAHLSCNLQFNEHRYLAIIAQNSSGYDNHLIIWRATEIFKEYDFLFVAKIPEWLIFFSFRKG